MVASSDSEIIRQTLLEFNNEFNKGILTDDSFLSAYTKQWLYQREIAKIKKEIDLLENITEQELNNVANEYPDYGDNVSYGGGLEHSD